MKQFNKEFERDVKKVIDKLKTLPKELRTEKRKEILRDAAEPMIKAAQAKAPRNESNRPRTITLKKGGKVTYYPGNLSLSVQELKFRKSPSIWVGPKVKKRRKAGAQYGTSERTADAYYAGFVEFGTSRTPAQPFMRPAFEQTKSMVLARIAKGVDREVREWIRKNKV
jgi:HK97 gp10 family phage protein